MAAVGGPASPEAAAGLVPGGLTSSSFSAAPNTRSNSRTKSVTSGAVEASRRGGRADRPGRRSSSDYHGTGSERSGDVVCHARRQLVQLVDGEATFQVVSMRGWTHRVWVRVANRQAACGCRANSRRGVRAYCDATIRGAGQLGLFEPSSLTANPTASRAVERGRAAIAATQECSSGLAAKSRELSCLSGILNRGGSTRAPSSGTVPGVATKVSAPLPLSPQPTTRRNKTSRPSQFRMALGTRRSWQDWQSSRFAVPGPGAVARLLTSVADASQCHKTKSQWQALRRVASAGVSVRLATGHSVRGPGRTRPRRAGDPSPGIDIAREQVRQPIHHV
eukprot:s8093_g4.t1